MSSNFFSKRPDVGPTIYAYRINWPDFDGLLKIGYTERSAAIRVSEQRPTMPFDSQWNTIELEESAMRSDGTVFRDHEVHRLLRHNNVPNPNGEWFRCTVEEVKQVIFALRKGETSYDSRSFDFKMRPEQERAVEKTASYIIDWKKSPKNQNKPARFLWNAKMRFGKTFSAYQLAKKMNWRRILIMTFKPAVKNAWKDDLLTHVDFKDWQFVYSGGSTYEDVNRDLPIVCFGSFQDYLGKNRSTGGIKTKNRWVHEEHWDCVILDEYHYGAWRENAKELFESEENREQTFGIGEGMDIFNEETLPITTGTYLYLSGTPFRALASGEFIEEQIFNWSYSDEQREKQNWKGDNNPYLALPRMVLLTYQLPDAIREIALQGEFNEFDLNLFFSASGLGSDAEFHFKEQVQKWLDLIRGSFLPTTVDNLKLSTRKPPMPFSDVRFLSLLSHTFWFMPNVSACHAMHNLIKEKQNKFFHDYKVIVAAGGSAGVGAAALSTVHNAMDDPLKTKTITLSCGKLTTGVTVKPWTGILMLRNISTPETYFQAAFRVQSPWTVYNPAKISSNKEEIIKQECYIFDFAPDRALRQIADYSCRLESNESSPEKRVSEFIGFLPVLAYDGSSMKRIDAAGVLDMAMSGTTATLLSRRWESALLVNVDNATLQRLIDNEEAMQALMKIEAFRNLNKDVEIIINKSGVIADTRKEANDKEISKAKRKDLSKEEREYRKIRKQIQEKLVKFATRIPIFMYLTDYREQTLKDVISKLEPRLFENVTGLNVADFELLISIGVFNSALMNDAVYKFKRYEDSSLNYTGINKYENENIGLFDTIISQHDAQEVFENFSRDDVENLEAGEPQ